MDTKNNSSDRCSPAVGDHENPDTADGHANVRRAFDASGLDKNIPFIADFVMKEIKALGQEHVFSCTLDGACKGSFPMIKHVMPV